MKAKQLVKSNIPKLIREKKGFTLVELIVTLVIAGIIIALSGGYLISSMNLFGNVADKELDASIADTTLRFIVDELQYASEVEPLTGPGVPTTNTIIYVADKASGNPTSSASGILYFRRADDSGPAVNLYGNDFYHRKTIGLRYEVNLVDGENKAVTITVDIYDAHGNKSISRSKSVRLLNAAIDKQPLAASTSGAENITILKIDIPS